MLRSRMHMESRVLSANCKSYLPRVEKIEESYFFFDFLSLKPHVD